MKSLRHEEIDFVNYKKDPRTPCYVSKHIITKFIWHELKN